VPVTQIDDGQIQQPILTTISGVNTYYSTMTILDPVTAIADGQIQATISASPRISVATSTSAFTSVVPMSSRGTLQGPKNVIHGRSEEPRTRPTTVRDGQTWYKVSLSCYTDGTSTDILTALF